MLGKKVTLLSLSSLSFYYILEFAAKKTIFKIQSIVFRIPHLDNFFLKTAVVNFQWQDFYVRQENRKFPNENPCHT